MKNNKNNKKDYFNMIFKYLYYNKIMEEVMMDHSNTEFCLLGSTKCGCALDNQKQEMTHYDNLSLFEKMQKKDSKLIIPYADILNIDIGLNCRSEVRLGFTDIILSIHLKDSQTLSIQLLSGFGYNYDVTMRDELVLFIRLLKASGLKLHDAYGVFDKILNSDQRIGDIISDSLKKSKD